GHGDLAAGARLDQGSPQDVAAGLAQGQDAGLGERRGGAATAGATERPLVARGIGHVDNEAVEGHGPHPAVEGARRGGFPLQADDLLGQPSHGGDAQALAGLTEGGPPRRGAFAVGLEPFEDLAVAVATEQAQGDDEPDQEPGGQAPAMRSVLARPLEDPFNVGPGDDTFQGAQSLTSGPVRARGGLLADVDGRSLLARMGL